MTHPVETETVWTGDVSLQLKNGRDWSVGDAVLSIHLDDVNVRFDGLSVAVLDRDRFRVWLSATEPDPLEVNETVWTVQGGQRFVALTRSKYHAFLINGPSLAYLLAVI